ncbi:MAG: NADH-quinone oxidoreductase subunit J [Mariprofundaceae bacterium]|nr:NADH-quinone oxidoreductase subunit J [Mariprofundaceae bacterium]
MESLFFFIFSGLAILSAGFVVLSKNAIHSVVALIFCFFNASALFLMLGAEFLAIILILIYVGAVMVLFMFVLMMMEVNFEKLREGFMQYLPLGLMISLILLMEFAAAAASNIFVAVTHKTDPKTGEFILDEVTKNIIPKAEPLTAQVNNAAEIGKVLYTQYMFAFEVAALILLVALIGAVVLTLRTRKDVKYQSIPKQVRASKADRLRKASL